MKKRIAIISIVAGTLSGIGCGAASFYALTGALGSEDQALGAWTTLADIGEANQSPYTRARVALYGIWGLPHREVIYFSAIKDSSGRALNPKCNYRITGSKPPARWWSLAVYRDGFYIDNPDNRYSLSMTTIAADPDGSWQILLSPMGKGKNGLALGNRSGMIFLSYRLYQPFAGVDKNRARVDLPRIDREDCQNIDAEPPQKS